MGANQQEARTEAISDRENHTMTPTFSLLVLGTAILLIVVMISKLKVHPFLALMAASLVVGVGTGSTVNINRLSDFETIEQVNAALKAAGFVLNTVGGEVKGDPQVMLEQSSTMADKADVPFSDGVRTIPSCFYEFALRYPQADGVLYPGFVEASADKIFESTNAM